MFGSEFYAIHGINCAASMLYVDIPEISTCTGAVRLHPKNVLLILYCLVACLTFDHFVLIRIQIFEDNMS